MERFKLELAGRTLSIETGRIAQFADGAVFVQYGETVFWLLHVLQISQRKESIFPFKL